MRNTVFYTAKGGQGCTTIACATAIIASQSANVLLLDLGWRGEDGRGDCAAVLGLVQSVVKQEPRKVSDTLTLCESVLGVTLTDYDVVIVDAGNVPRKDNWTPGELPCARILVTKPCYVALRRAIALPVGDGVVVMDEPGRALRPEDIAGVLNMPVLARVGQNPAVARAIDAGLMLSRLPDAMRRQLADVTDVTLT